MFLFMNIEEDVISVDIDACKNDISIIKGNIDELVTSCNELVDDLFVFQSTNHDVKGTAISEDYKDLGVIFGPEGFNKYVETLEEYVKSLEETINNWENTLNS